MSTVLPNPGAGSLLRYGFELAGVRVVPAAGVLTEVVAQAPVYALPRASAALAGMTNLRGTIVPLFDPRRLDRAVTGLRPGVDRALVFDRDEQRVGVLIDGTPELLSLQAAPAGLPRPAGVLAEHLRRAWQQVDRPERVWWEFDHRAAFAAWARHHPSEAAEPVAAITDHVIA